MHLATVFPALFLSLMQISSCIKFDFIGQIFIDLSTYNFNLGKNPVQEYSLTGTEGQTVSLYLFQNNYKQYNLTVQDGPDASARFIDITYSGYVPTTDQLTNDPVPIRSSGSALFVRIEAYNYRDAAAVDFQAMATVYERQAGCGDMVISVNRPDESVTNQLFKGNQQEGCLYVIHANDPTNNPMLAQYLQHHQNINSSNFFLYKGLTIDDTHLLDTNPLRSNTYVTDKYSILVLLEAAELTFGWNIIGNLNTHKAVSQGTRGQFMTVDYLQDPYPTPISPLEQNIILEVTYPMTSIRISFLSLFGTGSLEVIAFASGKVITDMTFNAMIAQFPVNITYDCDKIQLRYKTDRIPVNGLSGFYGLYEDASIYGKEPSVTSQAQTINTVVAISATVYTAYPSSSAPPTTRSVTRRPTETVTKSTQGLFSSALILSSTFLVSLM